MDLYVRITFTSVLLSGIFALFLLSAIDRNSKDIFGFEVFMGCFVIASGFNLLISIFIAIWSV